jgi:hypothetical protein
VTRLRIGGRVLVDAGRFASMKKLFRTILVTYIKVSS